MIRLMTSAHIHLSVYTYNIYTTLSLWKTILSTYSVFSVYLAASVYDL